jgi:RNA polymerase sigma-70 factor (ECF subfamily)
MQETLLIRSILAGHTADYTQLVKKYEAAVFRIVMGFVHQKEDAEDITQEVFIKAYQSLAGFAGQSSFSTWLYRIAIHTSLNALQKKKRRNIWDRVTDLLQLPSAARNPEQLLQDKSEQEKIRVAIDTLPEKQRMAFILSKYEELTQREVARIMEISDGAVEQLLIRARENLRKKLTTP